MKFYSCLFTVMILWKREIILYFFSMGVYSSLQTTGHKTRIPFGIDIKKYPKTSSPLNFIVELNIKAKYLSQYLYNFPQIRNVDLSYVICKCIQIVCLAIFLGTSCSKQLTVYGYNYNSFLCLDFDKYKKQINRTISSFSVSPDMVSLLFPRQSKSIESIRQTIYMYKVFFIRDS